LATKQSSRRRRRAVSLAARRDRAGTGPARYRFGSPALASRPLSTRTGSGPTPAWSR